MENANVKLETLTGSLVWLAAGQSERLPDSQTTACAIGNNWAKQESLNKLVLPFSTHLLGAPAYLGKRWGETEYFGSKSTLKIWAILNNKAKINHE